MTLQPRTILPALAALLLVAPALPGQRMIFNGRVAMGQAAANPAAPPTAAGKSPTGLNIRQALLMGFDHTMTDGGGYVWNIQYYGNVGNGTNNAYSNGLYCRINGNNIASNGQGWLNEAGDEVEIGPHNMNGVNASRRIKVYKDVALARWLDIFENPGSAPMQINVQYYTNTCWQIGTVLTNSGQATVGPEDWAFVTSVQGGTAPSLLHVFGDKRSKLRPTVQVQHNTITYNYALTIPANGTAVLCHFESQHQNVEELQKTMKGFRARTLLRDLDGSVRRLIANFPAGGGVFAIELERSESWDTVLRVNGDPLHGAVTNESFTLDTRFGEVSLPAQRVVGMVRVAPDTGAVGLCLSDGQVVVGVPREKDLRLRLDTGTDLTVPLADLQQWSYRITEQRPEEIAFAGPLLVLRGGERLRFAADATPLRFRTRNGTVDLAPKDLVRIQFDSESNGSHRVEFLNGTVLGGLLEPADLEFQLALERPLRVTRHDVGGMQFAEEDAPQPHLSRARLTNDDEVYARITNDTLTLRTAYGLAEIKPEQIRGLAFSPTHLGRAVVYLWNGTTLRGDLAESVLTLAVSPTTVLNVHVHQIAALVRSASQPPEELTGRIEQLVAMLGVESFDERQKATEELARMDPAVAPLLRKHLETPDPEVRKRIEEVLGTLESRGGPDKAAQLPEALRDLMAH